MTYRLHTPQQLLSNTIHLSGSKSISNRILIIKALSGLSFDIINLSDSDDTKYLKKALGNYATTPLIDVGHAGTDMRFLTAFLATKPGDFELTGSERLQQRPVKDLVEVLLKLGANITYTNKEGYPPLLIKGANLQGGNIEMNGNVSSQFITALLLIAPYFTNGLQLTIINELVSKPYVHMTIELMKKFGASVVWQDNVITVQPVPYTCHHSQFTVETDWSAASYYYSIVALSPIHTKLKINGLFANSVQADAESEIIYKNFGVITHYHDTHIEIIKDTQPNLNAVFDYDFINCPDIAQTVSCTCVGLQIPFYFKGLQTLKVKETDRIIALKNEIKKLGFDLEVTNDSINLCSYDSTLNADLVSIATYNDHRMAMSFATLCIVKDNLIIEDAGVVSKSYPLFWEHLKSIGISIDVLT